MRLNIKFSESAQHFNMKMEETKDFFKPSYGNVVIVERVDIPSRYGLVTYDNNRTITVT